MWAAWLERDPCFPGVIHHFRHSLQCRRDMRCLALNSQVCVLPAWPGRAQQAQTTCGKNMITCILLISDQEIPIVTENIQLIQHREVYGCPSLCSGSVTAIIRLQEQRGHYIMLLIRLGLGRSKRILQL